MRYEAAFPPADALRRLQDDSFRVMARHGGTVWGVWTALFGMASNELVVVTAWPDAASPVATLQDALPDGIRIVVSHELTPTVRPTSADPVTREGVYVHRFFRTREKHMQEIVDLSVDHTMFRMLFPVHTLPQIPNVGLWRNERRTSERGRDSDELHVRGIYDRHGRVIVLMTHNTDFGDAYEREADDPSYFHTFSVNGYAIGIDILLYAMTH